VPLPPVGDFRSFSPADLPEHPFGLCFVEFPSPPLKAEILGPGGDDVSSSYFPACFFIPPTFFFTFGVPDSDAIQNLTIFLLSVFLGRAPSPRIVGPLILSIVPVDPRHVVGMPSGGHPFFVRGSTFFWHRPFAVSPVPM